MKKLPEFVKSASTVDGIREGFTYPLLSLFTTDHVGSKHCAVILNDKDRIEGYDATHFEEFKYIDL